MTNFEKYSFYDIRKGGNKENTIDEKNIKKLNEIAKVDLLFIGSILDVICNWQYSFHNKYNIHKSIISKWYFRLYDLFHPLIIFGAGFRIPSQKYYKESYVRKIKIIAVRGNITLQRLKKNGLRISHPVILADPGILFPLSIKFKKVKTIDRIYQLCIIPHYLDKGNNLIKQKILVNQSLTLNINDNPYKFMKSLSKCKRVLSSSLHGLIASDSLGIPNMRMIVSVSPSISTYKFKDYYSAYGLNSIPTIDLRKSFFTKNKLKLIDLNYKISINMIKTKQCQLLINFPFQLNKEFKKLKIYI